MYTHIDRSINQASVAMSSRSVLQAPRFFTIGDFDWSEIQWPVHERYELSETEETGVVTVRPAGRRVGSWNPITSRARKTLIKQLLELEGASDLAVLAWAGIHGLPGSTRDSWTEGDPTYRVRNLAAHLARCWNVVRILTVQPTTDHTALASAMEALPHPHQDPAIALGLREPRHPLVAARHRALATVARAIESVVSELVMIVPSIVSSGSDIGVRPILVGMGPFGSAFLMLLAMISSHVVRADPDHPYHWRGPRACERLGCGTAFQPYTKASKYCSARCRKLAWLDRGSMVEA